MTTVDHFTVAPTSYAKLVEGVMSRLGDEILFDEYPEIPDVANALANPQVIVKDLGSAGVEDQLNMRASVGYKLIFAPLYLKTTSEAHRGLVRNTGATVL